MKIDVIIPAYRPGAEFLELIDRLERQTLPMSKILVMNTRSQVDVEKLLADRPEIQVVSLEKNEFDHGGTRDRAARLSEADYLLFLTQDALPADAHLVERLAAAFGDKRVKAAYARQLPKEDCRELERYTRNFNYPEKSRIKTAADLPELGIKTFFCSNVCAMYERETYLAQGGFPRRTIFNEDMIYAGGLIQSGYAIAYAAEAEHPEIFGGVASEGEGIRLVKKTAAHCLQIGKPWLIAVLVWQSGCKYLGYRLGKAYRRLPRGLVLRCTMNRAYWEREDAGEPRK